MELSSEMLGEYYGLVNALGRREWLDVKRKLGGEDSAKVMEAFKTYVKAWLARQKADEELEEYIGYAGPDTRRLMDCWAEQTRLMHDSRYAMRLQSVTFYDLEVAVYGKENVIWELEEFSDSEDERDESGWDDYEDE